MWRYSLTGGFSASEFRALFRDPLECDSSRRRVVVHRRSVPPLHPPSYFVLWGGVPAQQSIRIISHQRRPPSPVLLQCRPNGTSQTSDSPLVSPWFPPCRYSLVDDSPRLCQYPQVAARRPFFRLRYGAPQLSEDIFRLCPRLTDGRT